MCDFVFVHNKLYLYSTSLCYASLTRFWLFGNEDINGPIPAEIGNMSNLSKFDICAVTLKG